MNPPKESFNEDCALKPKTVVVLFLFSLLLLVLGTDYLLDPHDGKVGFDFGYFLPKLIQGRLFFAQQGFAIPMYSPYDCGGTPFFANPQSLFYSVPQLLTLALNGWTAIRLTVALFLILQALGTALLLSRVFRCSLFSSLLGAIIFASNTYYSSRMMAGHLTYHSAALLPFMAFFLLDRSISNLTAGLLLGFIGAYSIHSGANSSLIMSLLSTGLVVLLTFSFGNSRHLHYTNKRSLFLRTIVAGCLSAVLSAPKIFLAHAFLSQFPHNFEFDQTHSLLELLSLFGSQLFLMGAYRPFAEYFYWEYSASIPPVALLGGWLLLRNRSWHTLRPLRWDAFAALCTLTLFLLLLVGGSPIVDSMLDQFGLSKIRINVRFTAALLLPLVIISSKGFDRIRSKRFQSTVWLCTVVCFSLFLVSTRHLYSIAGNHLTPFAELELLETTAHLSSDLSPHTVSRSHFKSAADALLENTVQGAFCYEPIFMKDPDIRKLLMDGPINQIHNSTYNILHPGCFLFPDFFDCKPGQRIRVSESELLHSLLQFKNPTPLGPQLLYHLLSLAQFTFFASILVSIFLLWRQFRKIFTVL